MDGHRPRKRFGQNFLHDPNVIRNIIDVINPQPRDHLVEIGPGKGALTQTLLTGLWRLDIVELDRDLVVRLQNRFKDKHNIHIHSADALKFNFCNLVSETEKLRIIGNLPYNISTPLMFHLLEQVACILDMHFMLQKEVADRLAARPGTAAYGRLSLMIQYHCSVERLFIVPPGSFKPAPGVDSAFIRLTPRQQPPVEVIDEDIFKQIITQAFSHRRKTLRNTLKGRLSAGEIKAAGIDPGLRGEALTLAQFAVLSNTASLKEFDE